MNIDRQLDAYLLVQEELDRQEEAGVLSQHHAFLIKEYALGVFNVLNNTDEATAKYVIHMKQIEILENLQANEGQLYLFDK